MFLSLIILVFTAAACADTETSHTGSINTSTPATNTTYNITTDPADTTIQSPTQSIIQTPPVENNIVTLYPDAQYVFPVSETVDRANIQEAVNKLNTSENRVLIIKGTFIHDGIAITIPSNTIIVVLGSITLANDVNRDVSFFTNSDLVYGNENIQVIGGNEGLLDGNEANQTSGIQCGVDFKNVKGLKVDLKLKSFRTLDIKISGSCTEVERNNRLRRQDNNLEIQTIDAMDDVSHWARAGGFMTLVQDSAFKAVGKASIEMNTPTAGVNRYMTYAPSSAIDLSNRIVRLWVRIPDRNYSVLSTHSCLRIDFCNGLNKIAKGYYTPLIFADKISDFIYIDIPRSGCQYTGGFADSDWSNITMIRIVHYDAAPLDIWYGGLQSYVMPQTGVVSISCDDSNDNQIDALPIANSYGSKLNVSVVSDIINTPKHLTWEQVKLISSSGWDIVGHSRSHTKFTNTTIDEMAQSIYDTQVKLAEENIFNQRPYLILPWGAKQYSDDFYSTLRKHLWIIRLTNGEDKFNSTNTIPTEKYGRYITSSANLQSASLVKAENEALLSFKFGDWKDFTLHNLKEGGNITVPELNTFISYLYDFGIILKPWSEIAGPAGIPTKVDMVHNN
jgi:hypothetical protein